MFQNLFETLSLINPSWQNLYKTFPFKINWGLYSIFCYYPYGSQVCPLLKHIATKIRNIISSLLLEFQHSDRIDAVFVFEVLRHNAIKNLVFREQANASIVLAKALVFLLVFWKRMLTFHFSVSFGSVFSPTSPSIYFLKKSVA